MRRLEHLTAAAAILTTLAAAGPARATGHARVVRPDALAAVVAIQVAHPGGASTPSKVTVTVLVGGDRGHFSARLPDGTPLSLRFGVHRETGGYALYATTSTRTGAAVKRVGALAPGGSATVAGPGKATVTVTLVKVATLAALRRG